MEKQEFGTRLSVLRQKTGVSARDMSLSLGQSPGYINNIENGQSFPSMSMFFCICDYLHITESEFFDTELPDPIRSEELKQLALKMSDRQFERLLTLAGWLK